MSQNTRLENVVRTPPEYTFRLPLMEIVSMFLSARLFWRLLSVLYRSWWAATQIEIGSNNACRAHGSGNSHKYDDNNNGCRSSSYTKPCDNIYLSFIVLWTCEVLWIQSHGRLCLLPPLPPPSVKPVVLCVHYFGSEDSIGRRLVPYKRHCSYNWPSMAAASCPPIKTSRSWIAIVRI